MYSAFSVSILTLTPCSVLHARLKDLKKMSLRFFTEFLSMVKECKEVSFQSCLSCVKLSDKGSQAGPLGEAATYDNRDSFCLGAKTALSIVISVSLFRKEFMKGCSELAMHF